MVSWANAANIDIGSYNVTVSVSISELDTACNSSQSFILTVKALCEWTEDTDFYIIPASLTAQTYNVTNGQGTTSQSVSAFEVIGDTSCNSTDVSYALSAKQLEGFNIDTSWITFDSETMKVSWVAEKSNVGVYQVTLKGRIKNRRTDKIVKTDFVLNITDQFP